MQDRRRTPRKLADEIIDVFDTNRGQLLGRLVNLTTEGMMLVSANEEIPEGIFQIELVLEHPHRERDRVSMGIESLWTAPGNAPELRWTGFRIIDISLEAQDFIDDLIREWRTDSKPS